MEYTSKKHHDKDDDDYENDNGTPFDNLQKSTVLQEARIFHESQPNASKCIDVLTMILYLLGKGELFYPNELTEIFFGVTKLFQSNDYHLRRLVYLLIKEIKVGPGEALIVCACLSKDMTSNVNVFRGNAIKVLCKIMDPSMIHQIDRFVKQGIVDSDPFIVSSTLIAGHRLVNDNLDVVKRWSNEINEALSNRHAQMAQFHALSLLYQIKRSDRLAISKVVTSLCKNPPKGALGQCLLIRIISSLLKITCPPDNPFLRYLMECLNDKNFIIVYEAAKCILSLNNLSATQVSPAVSVLQEFLPSPIPVQRFAAVKTLSQIVTKYPVLVSHCSSDLENLISDPNRSIATLAVTTLLKTGVESNIDRLMTSISGFMSDINDEFRIVLVESIRTLCLKFAHKYRTLMRFLSSSLRDEGGLKFKTAVVDAIISIVEEIHEAQELGLEHFCEYIEDCEFPELSIKILHFLGEKGPTTINAAKYIRFIFNRVILETASVRAAAVTSLSKFAVSMPELRQSIYVLLQRCLNDNDDEVRDRALFCINLLEEETNNKGSAKVILTNKSKYNIIDLERSLQVYIENCEGNSTFGTEAFNFQKHFVRGEVEETKEETADQASSLLNLVEEEKIETEIEKKNRYIELLNKIPELAELGDIFNSSPTIELTEKESEYYVTCIKHTYENGYIVLQFDVENKMENTQLENISVDLEIDDEGLEEEFSIPEEKIIYGNTGVTFACLKRDDDVYEFNGIQCNLTFTTKDLDNNGEVDEDDEGEEDEYPLEDLDIIQTDFLKPGKATGVIQFRKFWEDTGDNGEAMRKFPLQVSSIQEGVNVILELMNMRACENDSIVPDGAQSHAINMIGTFIDDIKVLVRAGFILDNKGRINLKIAIRSSNDQLNTSLVESIG